jgi:hypothetical protein
MRITVGVSASNESARPPRRVRGPGTAAPRARLVAPTTSADATKTARTERMACSATARHDRARRPADDHEGRGLRRARWSGDVARWSNHPTVVGWRMPRGNPAIKLAITVDSDVHAAVAAAAEAEHVSVSKWITDAARDALRVRRGLAAVALWGEGARARSPRRRCRRRVLASSVRICRHEVSPRAVGQADEARRLRHGRPDRCGPQRPTRLGRSTVRGSSVACRSSSRRQ